MAVLATVRFGTAGSTVTVMAALVIQLDGLIADKLYVVVMVGLSTIEEALLPVLQV